MDFSSWARPASAARLGGLRPPQDPLASWFGRVQVALPGEDWSATNGAPMLTLFLGPWQFPVDKPNGVNRALRPTPPWTD